MSSKQKIQKFSSLLFILAIILSSVHAPAVSAQNQDGLKRQVNAESGKVSFIGPESGRALPAARALGTFLRPQDPAMALAKRFAPEFGIKDAARELTEMRSSRPDDGRVIVRYQQQYQGIPVMGGELIVNTHVNGDLYSMSGEVSPGLTLPTQPKIDSAQAAETALQALAKWYERMPADFNVSQPKLWIFDESLLKPSTRPVELVWRMEVTPKELGMPLRELVLVNAERGSISLHFNQVDTAWTGAKTSKPDEVLTAEALSPSDSEISDNPVTEPMAAENMPALIPTNWYVATTGDDEDSCTSTASPCLTINGAIGKAADGDTIKVAVGTYTGAGFEVVLINESITLSGGWNNTFTTQSGTSTIDGGGQRRGVTTTGSNVAIERFTIQNGNSSYGDGGGLYNCSGTLTLSDSIVSGNASTFGDGGGIYNCGILIINNTTISGNRAKQLGTSGAGGGGGIAGGGVLTLNNSLVSGNLILGDHSGTGINFTGTLILNNSTVSGNVGGRGEGIVTGSFPTSLNNSTISNHQSYGFADYGSTVTLKNTIIAGNGASGDCYNAPYGGTITSQGYNLIGNNTVVCQELCKS